MFARNVSFNLKSNMLSDYTRAFEKDVLPLLRKQNGFKDEITFAGPGGVDVTAISLWENKKEADNYNTNTYPQVLKTQSSIRKKRDELEGHLRRHEARLNNEDFARKAGLETFHEMQDKVGELKVQITVLDEQLRLLSSAA